MLDIPYISSPKNACALACYTMIASYFFPEVTFQQIAKISDWQEGYVVWGFKFWKWLTNKGIKVMDYDLIDLEAWANGGVEGLRQSVPEKEFNYIKKYTKNLEELRKNIVQLRQSNLFNYHRQKPTMDLLLEAIKNNNPAEVVLNSYTLDKIEGFALHRVVVIGVEDNNIIFHDPREEPRPHRKETLKHFQKSWLGALSEPELCIYERI